MFGVVYKSDVYSGALNSIVMLPTGGISFSVNDFCFKIFTKSKFCGINANRFLLSANWFCASAKR